MARPKQSEGIEQRTGRGGLIRYRGTLSVRGKPVRGPWTTDREEAISWRRRTRREAEDGFVLDRRLTLGEAIDEFTEGIEGAWIRNKNDEVYRPGVARLYRRHLAAARAEFGAKQPLDELRVPHIKQYKQRLTRAGMADATVRNRVVAIRALYVWAVLSGYATINPCAGLPLPVGEKRLRRVVTAEQASLLTGALTGRDRVAFALAWLAGLRAGELLACCWEPEVELPEGWREMTYVDLDARKIHIRTAIDTDTRRWGPPKTDASRRKVPIRSQLLAILEDYAEERTGPLLFPSDRVPAGRHKPTTPMAYTSLVQRLTARWKDAGLEPLDLHEGRHTFVSTLINAGAEPKKIMTYAGHSSITMTYDIYGHLFPSDDDAILRMLDEYDA